MSTRPKMVLFGGEKDGWETEISAEDVPKVFYVVPHEDEGKVSACKSKTAKLEMRDKLARLAYRYEPSLSSPHRFQMNRAPELDRIPKS